FRRGQRQGFIQHSVEHVNKRNLSNHCTKSLWRHVCNRANQHASSRSTMRNNTIMCGEIFLNKMSCDRDEVLESVGFMFTLSIFVPGKSFVLTATNMGDHIDKTAVDQRQARCAEACRNGDSICTITIEQAWRRTIKLCILVIEQRCWNQLAIRARSKNAAGDVIADIMPGRNLLHLEQFALATTHIVIV